MQVCVYMSVCLGALLEYIIHEAKSKEAGGSGLAGREGGWLRWRRPGIEMGNGSVRRHPRGAGPEVRDTRTRRGAAGGGEKEENSTYVLGARAQTCGQHAVGRAGLSTHVTAQHSHWHGRGSQILPRAPCCRARGRTQTRCLGQAASARATSPRRACRHMQRNRVHRAESNRAPRVGGPCRPRRVGTEAWVAAPT